MAFENGRLYTCDRCGAQAFIKTIGDGEADGGYTRWNKFEPLEGWGMSPNFGNLCPRCNAEWSHTIDEFMKGKSL